MSKEAFPSILSRPLDRKGKPSAIFSLSRSELVRASFSHPALTLSQQNLTFIHSRCRTTDTTLGTFWTLPTFNNCIMTTLSSGYHSRLSSLEDLCAIFRAHLCRVSLFAFFGPPAGWLLSLVSSTDLPIMAETGSCLLSKGS